MQTIPPEDAWWLAILSAVVFLTWTYHLYRTFDLWWKERSYRALRGLAIALMLQIGLLRIVLGAFLRAAPSPWLTVINNVVAPILAVMLLSGGLLLAVAWKLDDREEARYGRASPTD